MASMADVEKILLTHRCALYVGNTGSTTNAPAAPPSKISDNQFVGINNIEFEKTFPEQRINFGTERAYFHAAPDIELSFTLRAVQKHVVPLLETWSAYASTGKLTSRPWTFSCSPSTGTASTVTVQGKIVGCRWTKPSDSQTELLELYARIRVTSHDAQVAST